jgi:exodeoxyribonuclease VII large subunit
MTQFPLPLTPPIMPPRMIWSVSDLTARIRDLLARDFTDVLVEGEVSNAHPAQSGHLYFTLKDARAQVRCVCFRSQLVRLKFRPEDGLHVTVRGSLGVYEMRGEYQIYVEHVEPVGLGALQLAFEQLKKRLEAEGLFHPDRKKPLPMLPRSVGLVTSPSGAAVRDIVLILRRRFPNLHLILYPVRVQGEGAASEIVAAIKYMNRKQLVDVVIVARGGGSLEDLWAFNEEIVARAIAACTIPIISGIGHETDFTIADFVADVRASTPSAAAELVVRSRLEFDRHLADLRHKLARQVRYLLLESRHKLRELGMDRALRDLEDLLRRNRQHTDEIVTQLADALRGRLALLHRRFAVAGTRLTSVDLRARLRALANRLEQRSAGLGVRIERALGAKRQRIERLRVQLEERSPLSVLERGYAICYDAAGNVVRGAEGVAVGDAIRVQLSRGKLGARVTEKESE